MHVHLGGWGRSITVVNATVEYDMANVRLSERGRDHARTGTLLVAADAQHGWDLVDTLQDAALKLIAALMEAGVDREGLEVDRDGARYEAILTRSDGSEAVASGRDAARAIAVVLADRATALAADEDDADRYVRGVGL